MTTAPLGNFGEAPLTDRNGLEVLTRRECLALLGAHSLGRIGLTVDALPVVLPINYRVVDDQIVFRTGRGTKLEAASRNSVVAFEVDEVEPVEHTGWSVVVTGVARLVDDPDLAARLDRIGIPRWARSYDERLVTIGTDVVSGRRLGHRQRGGAPW